MWADDTKRCRTRFLARKVEGQMHADQTGYNFCKCSSRTAGLQRSRAILGVQTSKGRKRSASPMSRQLSASCIAGALLRSRTRN